MWCVGVDGDRSDKAPSCQSRPQGDILSGGAGSDLDHNGSVLLKEFNVLSQSMNAAHTCVVRERRQRDRGSRHARGRRRPHRGVLLVTGAAVEEARKVVATLLGKVPQLAALFAGAAVEATQSAL